MAWQYVNKDINPFIRYICASTDTKMAGSIGSIALEYDTNKYYITYDGSTWVEYKSPKLAI